jgi:hypothetical protein
MFRLPSHPEKTYAAVNRCIYCGTNEKLSDEHIIPFGLGGRWVLPKSSCVECAKKTSAFEHTCQRTMFGPLRMYYDLPTRRRKERPKKLPLKVKLTPNAEWSFIDVDQEVYPFLVLFPLLQMPDELFGRHNQRRAWCCCKKSLDSGSLISRRDHAAPRSIDR